MDVYCDDWSCSRKKPSFYELYVDVVFHHCKAMVLYDIPLVRLGRRKHLLKATGAESNRTKAPVQRSRKVTS
jgi:hypothetical protein